MAPSRSPRSSSPKKSAKGGRATAPKDLDQAADEFLARIEEEEAQQQPLAGLRQRADRYLDGDIDAGEESLQIDPASSQSRLVGLFDDATQAEGGDEELEGGAVSAEEVAAAEQIDLRSFQPARPGKAFEADAFEDWVRLSKTYKPLPGSELDGYVRMAKSDDPTLRELAETMLIRHNILWIVQCLQRKAGREAMSRPGPEREDLLSIGRWGFLTGIRKYDEERAAKNAHGTKANILTYTKFWIDKYVGEHLGIERYGLKEEAALDRDRILKAKAQLQRLLQREPTPEQIASLLEQQVRENLAKAGKKEITRDLLRRRGALGVDRIKELLAHSTSSVSLDAPVGDDNDAPGVGDYLRTDDDDALEATAEHERLQGILSRLTLLGDRRDEQAFRMLHGLPAAETGGRYPVFSPTEVGLVFGMDREQVERGEERVRGELWGEYASDPSERRWVEQGGRVPASIAADVAQLVDMRRLVQSEGIQLGDPDASRTTGKSPFSEDPGAKIVVTRDSFRCEATGIEGNLFAWLVARRGLTQAESLVEGMRLAQRIPLGTNRVTLDRVRAKRLGMHR